MAEDSDLERTEAPSGRKLQQARERGNIPRSRELATLATLLVSAGAVAMTGGYLVDSMLRVMRGLLNFDRSDISNVRMMAHNLGEASYEAIWVVLPLGIAVMVAGVAANLLISGWNFSPEAIEPKLSKLNPLPGIARMFSKNALVEMVKAILKAAVIGGAAAWMIWKEWDAILGLSSEALESAMPHFAEINLLIFLASAAAFALIAAIDVPYQLWYYYDSLKMTKEEVRQEGKETEGDPQIKARIRALQREASRRRMMQAVPRADVVVTNPLHYAVALKYEEGRSNVPVVVAKGTQLVAERIKELARENRVPVVEAPPLARALYRHVEVGDGIPASLFSAVAQVLAYIYQLNRQMQPSLPSDWQVPPELDPANAAGRQRVAG